MGLPHKAIETLGEGAAADPKNKQLKFDWLTSLRKNGSVDKSLAEAWNCVASHPEDPEFWDALKESLNIMDKPTEAGLASQAAAILRGEGAAMRSKSPIFSPQSFSQDVFASIALSQSLSTPASRLLAVVSDSVAQLYSVPLSDIGVAQPRRINREESHPLYGVCFSLSEAMDIHCDIYESSRTKNAPLCTVELTNPPCLVLSPAVRSLPRASQSFIVGFGLAQLSTRIFTALRMSPDELVLVLGAAARITHPEFRNLPKGTDPSVINGLTNRLKKSLPRRLRRALEIASEEYISAPLSDAATWQNQIYKTSLRAGAICSNDLLQTIDTTRQLEGVPQGPIQQIVAQSDLVAEMMQFWASTTAVQARRYLGLLGR